MNNDTKLLTEAYNSIATAPEKEKMYNFHFWIVDYKIQVVIEDRSLAKATKRMEEIFLSRWHKPKIQFQFKQ